MPVHPFQMKAIQLKLSILMVHQLKQSSFINQILMLSMYEADNYK